MSPGVRRRVGAALAAALLAACDGPAPSPATPSAADVGPPFGRTFVDVTARSGLDFRHFADARGEKLLPETMGSSPVVFDVDGDGTLDVFLPNGSELRGPPAPEGRSRLFRGRGDLTFEDVTARAGASLPGVVAFGGAAADYDGDGDEDLYVTALGDNVLLRNDGGVLRDATAEAGVAGGRWTDAAGLSHPEWSTAAAWFDADGDGDLDLFVANYVAWTPETEIFTTLDGVTKAFTTPDRYPGLPCRLFLQKAPGRFEDASEAAGLLGKLGKALGVALWEFDGAGRFDVVVANDTQPNFVFANLGGGRFEERGLSLGVAYDENGRARAGMGVDVADDRDDGLPVVAIGNFAAEPLSFYRRAADGSFRPTAADVGLAGPTTKPLTFGLLFLDADLDGRLDLALANGHLEPDVASTRAGDAYAQAPQLFRGGPNGRYADVSAEAGPDFAKPRVGRGLAAADFDGDGDLDLLMTANGVKPEFGGATLFENRANPGAPPAHRLRVAIRGKAPNTRGLGARVVLKAGGRTQTRYVRTGSSYAGQSDVFPTFGLGAATRVDELRVRFPNGVERVIAVDGVDRTLTVVE